jgi:hypothetical protein
VRKWDMQYSVEIAMKKYRKRKEYSYRHHSILGYKQVHIWDMYKESGISPG